MVLFPLAGATASFTTFFLTIFLCGFLTSGAELSVPLEDDVAAVRRILLERIASGDAGNGDFAGLILVLLFCRLSGEGGVRLPKGLLRQRGLNLLSLARLRVLAERLEAMLTSEQALGDRSKRCMA